VNQLKSLIESRRFDLAITVLIVVNAVVLGLETSETIMASAGPALLLLDRAILAVFVIEIVLRIGHRRLAFFRDGWSVFDFAVVAIALAPVMPGLSVLRALRVLRVLRLVTVMPRLKMVVRAPKIMRDSRSRPRLSVPSRWVDDIGSHTSPTICDSG
jgi:voltage-gated sodium channel